MNDQNEHIDNREWQLFELLEGNLSPAEEVELLSRIEKDSELAAEWELMKASILPESDLILPDKNKYHRRGTILPLFQMRGIQIAAALAAVILATVFFAVRNQEEQLTSALTIVQDDRSTEPAEETIAEPQNEIENSVEAERGSLTDQSQRSTAQAPSTIGSMYEEERVSFVHQLIQMDSRKPQPDLFQTGRNQLYQENRLLYGIAGSPVFAITDYPVLEPKQEKRVESLRDLVDQGMNYLVQPIRNTHINLVKNSENNKPVLKILYDGEHYQALAMLEFKLIDQTSTKQ